MAVKKITIIIEDYSDNKYGPSYLILGFTGKNLLILIQCSFPSRPLIRIVTLYQPDPQLWIDLKVWKTQDE